jgi:hypothetical protein
VEAPPADTSEAGADMPPSASIDSDAGSAEPSPQEKKDKLCAGFELDLSQALLQAACEVKPDPNAKPQDTKGRIDVKVVPSSPSVAPGGKVDLVVTYTNKLPSPVQLDFVVDPTPRFVVEAYDAKTNKRVDMPAGNPPPPPKNAKRPDPATPSIARVTIAANGTARMVVPWEAVRTRWAPEKFAGTPPEMGYPRKPAGGLPKGKYRLRVITPLTGVFEGADKEISAPTTEIGVN